MPIGDEDPAWFVFNAVWDVARENYPAVCDIGFIIKAVKQRLVLAGYEPDTKLIVGAVRYAAQCMFIDKVGRSQYRYRRTHGTREGGYQSSDITGGFLRRYAENSQQRRKRQQAGEPQYVSGLSVQVRRECTWCGTSDDFSSSDPRVVVLPKTWIVKDRRLYCPDCSPTMRFGQLPALQPGAQALLDQLQAVSEGGYLTRADYEWTWNTYYHFGQLKAHGYTTRRVVDDEYYERRGGVIFLEETPEDMTIHVLGWQLSEDERYVRADDVPNQRSWYVCVFPEGGKQWRRYKFKNEHEAHVHRRDRSWIESRVGEGVRTITKVMPEGVKPGPWPDFAAQ